MTLISRLDEVVVDDEFCWVGSVSFCVCLLEVLFLELFLMIKLCVLYVSNVVVKVDARGRGVASSMLVKCECVLWFWGYIYFWFYVDVDN